MSRRTTQHSEARAIDLAQLERLEFAASVDLIICRGELALSVEAADARAAAAIICRRIDQTLRVEVNRTILSTDDKRESTKLSANGWRRVGGAWIKGDDVVVHTSPQGRIIHVVGNNSTVVMGDMIGTSIVRPHAVVRLRLPSVPQIHASGAGDIELVDVDQDALEATISGSGDFRAAGRVQRLALLLSGSGDVKAKRLIARDVVIDMTGSGDASIHAAYSIRGKVIGSGDITIRGEPANRQLCATGCGDVRYRELDE